ncbi:MAG: FtsW/RodA/SpoVE family cell cycle protein [Clostridia bacterium]|nr:FtsW/RodA/SpoVE family cell cycle protein [Clostridia bacterium]
MDIPFLAILMTIVTIGLVMLFSASYTYSYYFRSGSAEIFGKQLIFAAIGIVLMFIISRIRYEYFKLVALIGVVVSIGLLLLVLVLPEYKPGFKRWINLGFTTFQPSEIAKIGLIMILAYLLDKNYKGVTGKIPSEMPGIRSIPELTNGKYVIYKSFTSVICYGLIILVFAGLVYLEHHVSGTILMLLIGVVMLWLGEVRGRWFTVGVIIGVIAVVLLIANPDILAKYAGERITAWLDKDFDPLGARWQTNNSLYAIGSGGLLGTGLGQSKQKHLYVSEPQNDFIFSIVCEELGFVGAVAIIILFALLIYRGIKIGMNAKDRFGALLAMGIVFQIGLQVALNIGVVSDFLPNTGISLPFFSAGGTSLVILLAEMGMVLSISRSARKKE